MKYAIVEISGKQFWIEIGQHYDFNSIPLELGKEIILNRKMTILNILNIIFSLTKIYKKHQRK